MAHPGGKNILNKMMVFEQTVTACKEDIGVALNDSINFSILFQSKKLN